MRLRRGVEVVRALPWLASGRFLAGIGRVVPSEFVERRTTRFGVLDRMGCSCGCSRRRIALRFIVSATGWEAMKWKTMARILAAPAPDSVNLLSGLSGTPHFGRIYVATEAG